MGVYFEPLRVHIIDPQLEILRVPLFIRVARVDVSPTTFVAVFKLIWHSGINQGLIYRWTKHSILPMSTVGMQQGLVILNLTL